jgi:hypothetical protein
LLVNAAKELGKEVAAVIAKEISNASNELYNAAIVWAVVSLPIVYKDKIKACREQRQVARRPLDRED